MIARRSWSLASAWLSLLALVEITYARGVKVVHTNNDACYDRFGNRIPCPKKPVSKTKVIIIVVVLGAIVLASVGFFLFRIFRRRRAQKYQALPIPPTGTMGAQGGVVTPAAPGEMGYAGPQPQLPYTAPQLAYNAPPNAPYVPSVPAYPPPQGPPKASQGEAASYYGYSAGAI